VTLEWVPPPIELSQLARRVDERFRESGAIGSRQPLESRVEIVEDGGVPFVVRRLEVGARAPGGGKAASPFLPPYDPTLLVGALSSTHVALLNKYNVVDRHLLIVTRAFEDQESPLVSADFEAACACLGAIDGVVFYNSGPAAGASQRHKHLQLVPFPLGPGAQRLPIERPLLAALAGGLDRVPGFAFRHRLLALLPRGRDLECVLAAYRGCISTLGLDRQDAGGTAPYNLLLTREWMLVVPRSVAACETIGVNALGFAGALVARTDAELALVRDLGPLQVLRRVAIAS
jgi:sulfate adenylyltransferase (ADP) / ATP adenylyltransferase